MPLPRRLRRALAALLLAAPLAAGCAYARDRLNDLADPWTLGVECYCVPVLATAKAAVFAAGFGFLDGFPWSDGETGPPAGFGFIGRNGFTSYQPDAFNLVLIGINIVDTQSKGVGRGNRGKSNAYFLFLDASIWGALGIHPIPRTGGSSFTWDSNLADFEVAAGCIGGARVGVNPFEILDFLLGFTTLDIGGDDEGERDRKEKP